MDITEIIPYVDSVAYIGRFNCFATQSESECCGYLHHFQTVATYVGIPKHSKTVQPDTCVTVRGIEVDTNMMQPDTCVTVRGIEVDTNMMQDRVPQDNWTMRLPFLGVSVEGQK